MAASRLLGARWYDLAWFCVLQYRRVARRVAEAHGDGAILGPKFLPAVLQKHKDAPCAWVLLHEATSITSKGVWRRTYCFGNGHRELRWKETGSGAGGWGACGDLNWLIGEWPQQAPPRPPSPPTTMAEAEAEAVEAVVVAAAGGVEAGAARC